MFEHTPTANPATGAHVMSDTHTAAHIPDEAVQAALEKWPPLKKALWHVLMEEKLNDGHYIKAFEFIEKLYSAAIRALSAEPAQGDQWQPTHRHVKRGTEYQRLGDAQVQCEDGLTDYELATVYVGSDGGLWVRRKSEFEDGRFAPLPAAPTSEAGK